MGLDEFQRGLGVAVMRIKKSERGLFKLPSVDVKYSTADLRDKFGLDPNKPTADGYGHHKSCEWFVQEVKSTDLDWAVEQVKSTIEQLKDHGKPVDKAFIVIKREPRSAKYEVRRGLLYYKGSKRPCSVRGVVIRVVHEKEIRRDWEWRFFSG